jgi:hypothetical protein
MVLIFGGVMSKFRLHEQVADHGKKRDPRGDEANERVNGA